MIKNVKNVKFWIFGILTSAIGLFIYKIITPNLDKSFQLTFSIIGINLSLIGLFIIMIGTSKNKNK